MAQPTSTGTLVELANLIQSSVQDLQRICDDGTPPFPSLDDPYSPSSEAFRSDPAAREAANRIAAAAHQLLATVLPPHVAVYALAASGAHKAACLRVCVEANVPEILREAGSGGLHVQEIAKMTKVSESKLGRVIRFLATLHIFKEVSPDVFANTRISSALDTGKSVQALLDNPDAKHDNTSGFPAIVCLHLDDIAKGASYLWETLSDPLTAHSESSLDSAFNRAVNVDVPIWEFLEQPEQAQRLRRFGAAMKGLQSTEDQGAILNAYEWDELPDGAVVVDVGAGIGSATLPLAEAYPKLQVVLQDRPPVIEDAKRTIFATRSALANVELQARDFFMEQPMKDVSVFVLKQITHDWPDACAVKVLSRLREAAQPSTKLIVIDCIMNYACSVSRSGEDKVGMALDVPGAVPREAPQPLLANYGIVDVMSYFLDMTMLTRFNAQERTLQHLSDILEQSGWRLARVRRSNGSKGFHQPIEAVPVYAC